LSTYIKQAPTYSEQVSGQVRRTVDRMLADIEREREAAIRRYSRELDGWDPPSFLVERGVALAAGVELDDELREHIAFAQDQVRSFARAQRGTLQDLEVQTLPGVTLGHRHLPVENVGSYVPGGRYPMLA